MNKNAISLLAAFLLMIILSVVSIRVGAVSVPFKEIWLTLQTQPNKSFFIVHELRMPRVAVAILAGIGLSVGGVILQSVLRNPLASPDVIGLTKGAGFLAAAVLFLFPASPSYWLPLAALAGAFLAFALLLLLTRRLTLPPATLALVGIAIGAAFGAGTQYLIVKHPRDISLALLWLAGSLWGRNWHDVWTLLPWIVILLPAAWLSFSKLNVLQFNDMTGASLGLNIFRERFLLILLAVALAGICVSAVGAIGFVGLLAPHIARSLAGPRHQRLIPLAALIGADLMLLGDFLGRIIIAPREVPAGIMTAVIGAPYFVYLLRRERRMRSTKQA
ncbi:FecCD family ABC transporter permease [Paenibacillus montanisoli]|uniref:Iron-dicitrate transporter subunit FecD n=1 Tax=Paenibacillus montanisoli TaxID=2081970 RepID=A0A328TZ50_9BACL|nr:iron chelate uptake ABC transporter family permease subunit [Paenibacillus montanisoli]RAP73875.1 iron-dicitrate transporter subunit FecD [Paenibacillus montanisoli]